MNLTPHDILRTLPSLKKISFVNAELLLLFHFINMNNIYIQAETNVYIYMIAVFHIGGEHNLFNNYAISDMKIPSILKDST